MANQKDPLSLRFQPAFLERLQAAAQKTGIPKHTLAQVLLYAGVDAIEAYKGLVLPAEFDLVPRRVPQRRKAKKIAK